MAILDGSQHAATLSGGEDAACKVAGPTTTGASRGIHCRGSSPTVSNCHVLRYLSVGMEGGANAFLRVCDPQPAGDTKPTIANSVFAAYYQLAAVMHSRECGKGKAMGKGLSQVPFRRHRQAHCGGLTEA